MPAPRIDCDLLIRKRYERGWSQTELAKRSRISRQTICDIEKGRSAGSPATHKALAKALRVDLATLYGEVAA